MTGTLSKRCDRWTDRQTARNVLRAAWLQLKMCRPYLPHWLFYISLKSYGYVKEILRPPILAGNLTVQRCIFRSKFGNPQLNQIDLEWPILQIPPPPKKSFEKSIQNCHDNMSYFSPFCCKVMTEWPWSRSKVIACNTTSHASDDLFQIWKESLQICTCCRADTKMPYFGHFIAKSWLNDVEDLGQGQRSLCEAQPLMPVIICA